MGIMSIYRFLLGRINPRVNEKEFRIWAFGTDCPEEEMFDSWNKLHSDIFILKTDGRIREDLYRMVEAYKSYLEEGGK